MSKSKVERSFGGELVTAANYREMPPEQRRLENKHLRAYLKGRKVFMDGWEDAPNEAGLIGRHPRIFVVKENIKNE